MITAVFSSARHDQVSIFTKQTCQAAAGRHCSPLSLTRASPGPAEHRLSGTRTHNLQQSRDIVSTVLTVWSWQVAAGWCWVPGQPQNSSALYCVEREWPRTQQAGLSWPQHCCTVTNTGYRTLQPPHRFRFPHTQCISWHFTRISYQLFLISTLTKSLHLNWSDSHFTCHSWK